MKLRTFTTCFFFAMVIGCCLVPEVTNGQSTCSGPYVSAPGTSKFCLARGKRNYTVQINYKVDLTRSESGWTCAFRPCRRFYAKTTYTLLGGGMSQGRIDGTMPEKGLLTSPPAAASIVFYKEVDEEKSLFVSTDSNTRPYVN